MTDEKTAVKKPVNVKCVALRALCTAKNGMVKQGGSCICTPSEYEKFKAVKAV